ncbi:MAG: ABC transporter permease, partial [Opitutaceae bacterium]|nr:ABC transporter permease [Opitutaceae bacterium]
GRRAPGISAGDAAGFIAHLGERLAADHPGANAGATWRTVPIDHIRLGDTGGIALAMLVGLSGFVLLIACLNLANFLLARTMACAREFAVRGALGASRLQLLSPLLLEALVLALAGGACAVLVAMWGTNWIQAASTGDNGEQVVFTLNWSVLAWAFAASLLTAFAFGLAPAMFAMRLDLNATLKSGGRSVSGGRGHQRLRHALIVGQFALAMVLLCGAALMIRGLHDLNNRREGWSSEALVTGTFRLPETTYPGSGSIAAFERRVLERLAALPGVESASLSTYAPFLNWYNPRKFLVEGRELPEPGHEPAALVNGVSPDYFATVGTRLVAGRAFDARDAADAPRTFIISQAMAAALFGMDSPIGRRIAFAAPGALEWGEVVGVAQDVKSIFPEFQPVAFQLYQPLTQDPRADHELAVRVSGVDPVNLVESIRTLMAELDADLPVTDLKPADTRIARANYQLGVLGDVLSSFAVLGLGLAAMGIYGVIARVMAQRTGEFGVRLALGAQLRDIRALVLTAGVKLAVVGSILGLLGAFGVAQILALGFPLMRLERGPVIAGATMVLILVALVACYLPARRAARINPTEVLRAD